MRAHLMVTFVAIAAVLGASAGVPTAGGTTTDMQLASATDCIRPYDGDGFPYLPSVGGLTAAMVFVDYPDAPGHAPTDEVYAGLAPAAEAWFEASSYGQLDLQIVPVPGWQRMSKPSQDYAMTWDADPAYDAWREHAQEAVDLAAGLHDFSDVDIVYPVSSAGAVHEFSPANSAWPGDGLMVDGREIRFFSNLGGNIYDADMSYAPFVIVHETGHLLGEPDYYAYDGGDIHRFVGAWDIMGSMFEGRDASGWTKVRLGWLHGDRARCLTGSVDETITLSPMTQGGNPTVAMIPTGTHTGVVLEARHPEGLDATACSGGLLIAHVDDEVPSGHGPLRIEQARPSDPARDGDCGPLSDAPFVVGDVYDPDTIDLRVEVLDIAADGAVTARIMLDSSAPPAGCDGRLFGSNRFDTAARIAAACIDEADVVYVATGGDFPDALAGGVVAAMDGAPVLLVQRDAIPKETAEQLERLRPGGIVVLGGSSAVSDHVRAALQAYTDGEVAQLAGRDRFQTAVAISRSRFDPSPDGLSVFIATGQNFPDALAGVPPAAVHGGPILLVTRTTLPESTREELARLAPTDVYVLGGAGAVSDAVLDELRHYAGNVVRVAGTSRYDTAVRAGALVGGQTAPTTVFIATGENYPDALAGGAVAGALSGPILLVGRNTAPAAVLDAIEELRPDRLVVLGGTGAVSEQVEAELRARMGR